MKVQVYEWISGPFANATIEGFIINNTPGFIDFEVCKIENVQGDLPPQLTIGSIHNIPRRVLNDFYVCLNKEQQEVAVALAIDLGQVEWARELQKKFCRER